MAIRDLLWRCPLCGEEASLRKGKGAESCNACGARFRRLFGSLIQATPVHGPPIVHSASEWDEALWDESLGREPGDLSRLVPRDSSVTDGQQAAGSSPPPRASWTSRVHARFTRGEEDVRWRGEFLNRIERFGPVRQGLLSLADSILIFRGDDGESTDWNFDSITTVQPSSSTLQIKARGRSVVSFRFLEASVRLWEMRLELALREHYRAAGLGEIVEFQPRIVVR